MLNDPTRRDVVRWGKRGDTFIVVEVRPIELAQPGLFAYQRRQLGRTIQQMCPAEAFQA